MLCWGCCFKWGYLFPKQTLAEMHCKFPGIHAVFGNASVVSHFGFTVARNTFFGGNSNFRKVCFWTLVSLCSCLLHRNIVGARGWMPVYTVECNYFENPPTPPPTQFDAHAQKPAERNPRWRSEGGLWNDNNFESFVKSGCPAMFHKIRSFINEAVEAVSDDMYSVWNPFSRNTRDNHFTVRLPRWNTESHNDFFLCFVFFLHCFFFWAARTRCSQARVVRLPLEGRHELFHRSYRYCRSITPCLLPEYVDTVSTAFVTTHTQR